MDLTDFMKGSRWAIMPEAMEYLQRKAVPQLVDPAIREKAMRFMELDPEAARPELTVKNGVAVIPIAGTINRRASFYSSLFGGAAISRIRADIEAAMADRRVRGIVVYMDSPGGIVSGVHDLSAFVREAKQTKPIVVFSDGAMASAGYWIGSAASQVIISATAQVGSIGILIVHTDYSEMDKRIGIKDTYITTGKYKALGNGSEPLSDEAKKVIESRLFAVLDVFVADIAAGRNMTVDAVRALADGRVWVGAQAVEAGLADRLGNIEDAIAAAGGIAQPKPYTPFTAKEQTLMENEITTVAQLQTAFPQLCKQLADQAVDSVNLDTPRAEGATAERERLLALSAIHFGEEAGGRFSAIVNQNITAEQYQAMRDAIGQPAETAGQTPPDADAEFRRQMQQGIEKATAPDVGAGGGDGSGPKTFMEAVETLMAENKCTRQKAMSKAAAQYPELHQKYIQAANQKKK